MNYRYYLLTALTVGAYVFCCSIRDKTSLTYATNYIEQNISNDETEMENNETTPSTGIEALKLENNPVTNGESTVVTEPDNNNSRATQANLQQEYNHTEQVREGTEGTEEWW